eukprot:c16758_g1_i1.p1 GENE.c16758_g1_i1~~c16758_g1_i1.p1  ORF type:complete len:540 (+),score=107.13 c16758_g1_i1:244-1620(+)
MADHMRAHSGERPFVCEFDGCDKRFSSSNGLKYHKRTHTGEKLYVCQFDGCNKYYTTSSNLKEHTRVHSGEKPYMCTFEGCNKTFTTSNGLKYHARAHTGEKPFLCSMCGKQYSTNSNLMEHKRGAHENAQPKRAKVTTTQVVKSAMEKHKQMSVDDSAPTSAPMPSVQGDALTASTLAAGLSEGVTQTQVAGLIQVLSSPNEDELNKANAATEMWRMVENYNSADLSARQMALCSMGAIEHLLNFIVTSNETDYQFRAFGALSNLCYRNTDISHKLGNHPLLVDACERAMQRSNTDLVTEALRALNNVAFYSLESHKNIITLVPSIVQCLDNPSQCKEVRFMCCNVLENLSMNDQNKSVLVPVVHSIFKVCEAALVPPHEGSEMLHSLVDTGPVVPDALGRSMVPPSSVFGSDPPDVTMLDAKPIPIQAPASIQRAKVEGEPRLSVVTLVNTDRHME